VPALMVHMCILLVVCVTSGTMRFKRVRAALGVRLWRYWFKMRGIHAGPVPTKVIQYHPIGDIPHKALIPIVLRVASFSTTEVK
jgi:hypothetical protein